MCEKYEEVGNGSIRMSVSELSPFSSSASKIQGESFRDEKNQKNVEYSAVATDLQHAGQQSEQGRGLWCF